MATIQHATWKVHINELHTNLIHSVEDKMRATMKHFHYSVKGTLEVCEDFSTVKINHKKLCKVAEYPDLKPGKIIYLDISSKNKPCYGVSKN